MKIAALLTTALFTGVALYAADADSSRKAPELSYSIPGKAPQLLSQYRGKVVALEFIFTTCPHCQAASKLMTKLQQEYGPRGFQALDIAVNANADLLVENFVKDYQVGFPVGWVPQEQMVSFMGFSSARFVVPQLALIDRKGMIRYQTPAIEDENWDKLMKEDALRKNIEELLAAGTGNSTSLHRPNTRAALAKQPANTR